jgi:hypothetical protein
MRINVAGDLQFELHQKTLLFTLYQNCLPQALHFVEYAGKVFENMSGRSHDRLQQVSKWDSRRNDCSRSNDF